MATRPPAPAPFEQPPELPPFVRMVPVPAMVPASIQTEPPAPPEARVAPLAPTVPLLVKVPETVSLTAPPPVPPPEMHELSMPPPDPRSTGFVTEPYVGPPFAVRPPLPPYPPPPAFEPWSPPWPAPSEAVNPLPSPWTVPPEFTVKVVAEMVRAFTFAVVFVPWVMLPPLWTVIVGTERVLVPFRKSMPPVAMVRSVRPAENVPVDGSIVSVPFCIVRLVTTPTLPLFVMSTKFTVKVAEGRLKVPPAFVVMLPLVAWPVSVPPLAIESVIVFGMTYLAKRFTVRLSYVCEAVVTWVVLLPLVLLLSTMRSPLVWAEDLA